MSEGVLAKVAEYMRAHSLVLATGESCTAGLIAATIADVPGAGDLLHCAFVTYSPQAKTECLGVRRETIERFGLTSEAVAREMALGALSRSGGTLAIGNTGVADDSIDGVPPGTQCFAWAFRTGPAGSVRTYSETRRFDGDRHAVRKAAAAHALTRIEALHRQALSA